MLVLQRKIVCTLLLLASSMRCGDGAFLMPTSSSTASRRHTQQQLPSLFQADPKQSSASETANALLEKARLLRAQVVAAEVAASAVVVDSSTTTPQQRPRSQWNVDTQLQDDDDDDAAGYRLYFDIGREDGSWMDPRWGASGRRIEGSIDVAFARSADHEMWVAPQARLRGGFDAMRVDATCSSSCYRIEKRERRIRFSFPVEGTAPPESGGSNKYGDVWIPQGALHFSLPIFGGVDLISSKEGLISVRQYGWHTGWRREESRVVGTFRMKKIDEATKIDGF